MSNQKILNRLELIRSLIRENFLILRENGLSENSGMIRLEEIRNTINSYPEEIVIEAAHKEKAEADSSVYELYTQLITITGDL